jgi:hypothetical protein
MTTLSESLAAHTYAQIAALQVEITNLLKHAPSKRRSSLIEMREMRIEALMGGLQLGDEMAEAEVVEISTVEEQLAEAVALLNAAHPRTRWFTQHSVLMGIVGIDTIRIERSARAWSGKAQGPWKVTYEYGEEVLDWSHASGADLLQVATQLMHKAMAARSEGIVPSEVAA